MRNVRLWCYACRVMAQRRDEQLALGLKLEPRFPYRPPKHRLPRSFNKTYSRDKENQRPAGHLPPNTTLQRHVRSNRNVHIPRFYYPQGKPTSEHQMEVALKKISAVFHQFPNQQVVKDKFHLVTKACDCPLYWKMPLFAATGGEKLGHVESNTFLDFWKKLLLSCHDQASWFIHILTRGLRDHLTPDDLGAMIQDVVDSHPGLTFLKEATEFHSRYVHTKADWSRLRRELVLPELIEGGNVNEKAKELTRAIQRAMRVAIPYQAEVEQMKKQVLLVTYRIRKKEYESALAKREGWERYVQEELRNNARGIPFQMATGKIRPPAMISTLRRPEGDMTVGWEESARLLVIARIFYCVNRSWSGRISLPELRRSNLLRVIQLLEEEEDINQVTSYFSYEHFYVIYCRFWELDRDHDLFIDRQDLHRHSEHALSTRIIERIFSGAVTRGARQQSDKMSYTEFVWFLLSEEDKTHPTAIEYWFRCMDLDGDGYLSMYELEYFYEEQLQRMEAIGIETLPFEDCLCQMLDMIHPATPGKISLSDLKQCKMTSIFFDTFFNLEKYLDHEQRDPFASQREHDTDGQELSDWDRYAAEEYELLVAEEGSNDQQEDITRFWDPGLIGYLLVTCATDDPKMYSDMVWRRQSELPTMVDDEM
uniref:(California timema) hypothetical protein n=1 Tax=Timema californicum TaxID=61474 RepID=A0A7R9P7T5_TIMCA|nr:unnamed protein product [Timema californicum]